MARNIVEIQAEIKTYKDSRPELVILNSGSNTAIWRAWVFLQSLLVCTIEVLFDTHRSDVELLISETKPHRDKWYRNKTLAFQQGMSLVEDSDVYDNTGLSDEDITALKVVKYASAKECGSQLLIKVAGETDGVRDVLTPEQYDALTAYLAEIKDAGVLITITNQVADMYRATFDIYYDPMILDGTGRRLDGTNNTPVQSVIKDYISNLPFNGEYTNMALVDELQKVSGVVIPELIISETKFGLHDWTIVDAKVNPDSGYLKVYNDADLTLNFIAYG